MDTETTGLKVSDGHRIAEISAIKVNRESLEPIGEPFQTYINPQRAIDPNASKINGLTEEFLADKPYFEDIVDKFLEFIGDDVIVAHNAPFDRSFLNSELESAEKAPLKNRFIDTLSMACSAFPGEKVSLDALCERFGIDRAARTTHGALIDAQLLLEVYKNLVVQSKGAIELRD